MRRGAYTVVTAKGKKIIILNKKKIYFLIYIAFFKTDFLLYTERPEKFANFFNDNTIVKRIARATDMLQRFLRSGRLRKGVSKIQFISLENFFRSRVCGKISHKYRSKKL